MEKMDPALADRNYDDFDYLDGPDLYAWLTRFNDELEPRQEWKLIEDEYLPRFEAAIHRLHSTTNAAWSHPYIQAQPFEIVTVDPDEDEVTTQDMISEGGYVNAG